MAQTVDQGYTDCEKTRTETRTLEIFEYCKTRKHVASLTKLLVINFFCVTRLAGLSICSEFVHIS